jgi:RadC-like JAB domain
VNTSSISLIAQLDDGSLRPATPEETIAAAREHMSRRVRRGTQLSSPKATRDFLSLKLGSLEREVFPVIFLDKRHRLISYQEMFQGYSPFGRAVRAPALARQRRVRHASPTRLPDSRPKRLQIRCDVLSQVLILKLPCIVHSREVVKGELHAASARNRDVRAGPLAQQESVAKRRSSKTQPQ